MVYYTPSMLEFQEKRRLRNFLYSRVTLIVLLVAIFFLLNAVWKVYQKQDLTKDNLAKAAANLQGLQAREKMLSSEIERLKTESGTEQEIREKYGLVKPGEEVITVVDSNTATSTDFDTASNPASFWQKIMDWFN